MEYPGRKNVGVSAGWGDKWRDRYVTRGWGGVWASYEDRYELEAGLDDIGGLFERAITTIGDRDSNDRFFNDGMGYWSGFGTRSNLVFTHGARVGHWRAEDSATWDYDWATEADVTISNADHNRSARLGYSLGQSAETFRHFFSFALGWKRDEIELQYNGSVLRHQARRQQHILSFNYELTTSMTIGGRLVFERDELAGDNVLNPYISFRRSGEAGIETFLILGDPSGDEFVPRIEGKMLFPLGPARPGMTYLLLSAVPPPSAASHDVSLDSCG